MKIAYFGYDFFHSCLERLLFDNHEVIRLFTFETDNKYNFNEKVVGLAKQHQVPITYEEPSPKDIESLLNEGCGLLVVAAYPYRVPVHENGVRGINIHPTLLPEGREIWPLPHIILKDLRQSGVSIQKLDASLDAGDVLAQARFTLTPNEDIETLSCKSQLIAPKLLASVLSNFESSWANAVPQQGGSTWAFPSDDDMELKWDLPVKDIDRVVRAFGKMHSTAHFDGKAWNVADATVWEERHGFAPGTVVLRTNREVLIAASNGYVCLRHFEEDKED